MKSTFSMLGVQTSGRSRVKGVFSCVGIKTGGPSIRSEPGRLLGQQMKLKTSGQAAGAPPNKFKYTVFIYICTLFGTRRPFEKLKKTCILLIFQIWLFLMIVQASSRVQFFKLNNSCICMQEWPSSQKGSSTWWFVCIIFVRFCAQNTPGEKYKKKLLFLMFKSNLFEALFKHASICTHST